MSLGMLSRRAALFGPKLKALACNSRLSGENISRISTRNMSKLVVTEKTGHVMSISINRPEVRNCVNVETADQLYEAFQEFERDDDAYVAVFYGKGGYFCGGYDLKSLSQAKETPRNIIEPQGKNETGPMGPSRMMFSKPVIAAVEGYAVAGGMELSLMCDMRVVDENAIMGVYCRRFGVPLMDGGTARLPQLIGLSRALDLILTGRPIKADEALQLGLANRVAKSGTAVGVAMRLALELCRFPQATMRGDRRAAYYSTYDAKSWVDALKYEYECGMENLGDAVAGAKNFTSGVGKHGNFEADFSLEKYSKLSKL